MTILEMQQHELLKEVLTYLTGPAISRPTFQELVGRIRTLIAQTEKPEGNYLRRQGSLE